MNHSRRLALACLLAILIAPAMIITTTGEALSETIYLPLITKVHNASPEVVARSSNAFIPYAGASSLYLVGEVRNQTSSNVEWVKITATFRNAGGDAVGSDYTYAIIDVLTPGMTSPFRLIFTNGASMTWTTYDLVVTWSTSSAQPYLLDIVNQSSSWDSLNAYHVAGKARNQFPDQRTSLRALVTLYDTSGKVIGVDWTDTVPNVLDPGAEADFDTDVYFWKNKPDRNMVGSHLLQVYQE